MAMIRKFPPDAGLTFIGRRHLLLAFSALLVAASIAEPLVLCLNFGIDIRGAIDIQLRTAEPVDLNELRQRVNGRGIGEVTLQQFGEPTDVLINVAGEEGDEAGQSEAVEVLRAALGEGVEIRRQEVVGPKVGDELVEAGTLATVLALLGIGLYVWLRFEWQFGVAALVALAHDIIATIGFYALTQIEFNLATLAAVLTVVGYSINDTVVIFDRVREMRRRYKKISLGELLNRSTNTTLSRTILTSFTTLLALFALFFFGGGFIRGFPPGLPYHGRP